MTFASTFDAYCASAGCTNRQIAELSGISPSALSRYRRGEREPEPGSPVVKKLSAALADLSAKNSPGKALSADTVNAALEATLANPQMAGMSFNSRLDTLMRLIGIRNVDFAEVTGVDPSYISRIRHGQRMPADMRAFASICSHLTANLCIKRDLIDEVGELVGTPMISQEFPPDDEGSESEIAEVIEIWLTGSEIFTTDIAKMDKLFEWIDESDFSEWLTFCDGAEPPIPITQPPVTKFYYGLGGMHSAETEFITTALNTHARTITLSSDMPLQRSGTDLIPIEVYMDNLTSILHNGCHVNVLFSLERPLEVTIKSLRRWIPYFITGNVTPGFLKGVNNRLFYHVNRLCDTCVLSAEAVMGHEKDGRCYFSTRPEDIAYYQKKIGYVLEKASPLIEIYRECDPEQRKLFREAEAARESKGTGKRIGANRFENLRVVSYPGDCVVLSIPCGTQFVHLVSRHPKINYIVARMD